MRIGSAATPVAAWQLRAAMSHFATGVTVVTAAAGDGARFGITANAVSSVSLDPPLTLVCVRDRSATLVTLLDVGHFAVNVLHEGQGPLAQRFGRRGNGDRWAGVETRAGLTGAPLLADALATVECAVHEVADGGDHQIVIGRVLSVDHPDDHVAPLLFYRGAFTGLRAG
ncbi:MAG: flavin reductase domain protein FMN-binding protein [Solirubrobacterales bacterium]|nr:flavin reductase domain protein FMN-binding protein [Solirubrobacterales bacterium]